MTIDHTGLQVPEDKYEACLQMYLAALKPLGYEIRHQFGPFVAGLGPADELADFWVIGTKEPISKTIHIAFRAKDRDSVNTFHAAGLATDAKDNGAPGVRGQYHPNYYAAYILDPVGNNIEVVCHAAV